jgi:hypothetical protein
MQLFRLPALCCGALLACAPQLSHAAPPPVAPVPLEIVSAEFGVFDDSTPGELVLEPTTSVPHVVGQRYGWVIEVRSEQRSLSVREEYVRPNVAVTRPAGADAGAALRENLDVPVARRTQVSQRQLVPVDGMIYGEWAVGPNEPAGHRQLRVVIEGRVETSFEYDVK